MAGPRWARCYSWGHGYCWALVTPVGVSGIWTLWYWIFSLQPPRAIWHGLTWFTAKSKFCWPKKGHDVSFLVQTLFVRTVFVRTWRASVLTGGGELMLLQVFDHPHWVKFDVYSKVCPLLTPEFLRTGTTFFKSIVENLTRDYRTIG